MRYLSVCSGIEAATAAWEPLGWEAVGFSEIEKFPSNVLAHYYPDVPNFGDMTQHETWARTDIDVLVGGTPCQSFSVAGLRKGMQDPRGNLALTYLAIAERYRPCWLVWENVPGVLSSNEGRDFGSFLGGLGKLGYGFSYRVLDAQYFGVPQRRRRVFVVGCIGDWRSAAKVLFEPESLQRNPPPSRKTREEVTASPRCRPPGSGGINNQLIPETVGALTDGAHNGGGLTAKTPILEESSLALCLNAGAMGRQDAETETLIPTIGAAFDEADDGGHNPPVTFNWQNGGGYGNANEGLGIGIDEAGPQSASQVQAVAFAQNQRDEVRLMDMAVRRLTPLECERLQGFPDQYTDIPGASDSARYKALGNSMAVPVMRWIGEQIDAVK